MQPVHDVARTLCAVLDNQEARTDASLHELRDDVFAQEPGGGCNSIHLIGRHLVVLRQFQLRLLESPLAAEAPRLPDDEPASPAALRDALRAHAALVRRAIEAHDPDDWFRVPDPPRPVRWGEDPAIVRFTRPFNDFTNHLGAIRAIRQLLGNPAERVQ